jgi:aryl-alcohol dehydrogenase-like predicted oxidoreductase
VHLYQLHDRIGAAGWGPRGAKRLTVSEVLGPGGVAEALVALKQEGKVSALGLTTFGGDPQAVAEVIASGVFDTINCSFHTLNPTALVTAARGWPALDYGQVAARAHAQGMTVLGIRALAGGQLLDIAAPHPEIPDAEPALRALDAALDGRVLDGHAGARTAMAWVLGWYQVGCLIAGISAAGHVDDAVEAADSQMWSGPTVRAWCATLYRAAVPEPLDEETIAWRR